MKALRKPLFLTIVSLFFLAGNQMYAQSSNCTNSDFEQGNFNGWRGESNCCPSPNPNGIINGVHTIMSGTDMDPFTCNTVPIVAPGGSFSARLGNSGANSQIEKLRYTLAVTQATSLFIYKYAVVLEDPGHEVHQQPRFDVSVIDEQGNIIDPVCGVYNVVAGPGVEGFETCGNVMYRNWTTVGLNLFPYIGQNITIEFLTADCSLGGHFGYAYIDAYCSSLDIETAYCIGSNAAELTAPIGFEYLWSTGETSQSIILQNPQQGAVYTCVLTSVNGCQVTVSATIAFDDPIADFTLVDACFDNAVFNDTSQTLSSNFTIFSWDFGDGGTSDEKDPVHVFPAPGTYTVSFTLSNALGCSRSVTKTVTVYEMPSVAISYALNPYCTSILTPQPVTLTGTGNFLGGVFSSTAGLILNPVTGTITPSLSQPGNYQVTYTMSNTNACAAPPVTTSVTIMGTPTAIISYANSVLCQNTLAAPQNVTLTGTGAFTGGTYTVMPSGLAINPSTGTINIVNSTPGNYTVNYTLVSSNQCPNFIASTSVSVLPSPSPTTTLTDGQLCIDDAGQIVSDYTFTTGLSTAIYDFQWFFENNLINGATDNSYTAVQPGNYSLIITNSQTGCVSVSIDAIVSVVAVVDDIVISIEEEFSETDVIIHLINGIGSYLYQLDNNTTQTSNVFYDVSSGMHTIKVTDYANCTNITKDFFVLGYPKFFTPNADGINDYWKIETNNLISASISIYDRYGKLLHVMKDDKGWDGTYLGSRMPATDYWFIVKYKHKSANTEQKTFKAHFSLKR